MTTQRESGFTMDYDHLITLWTSGVRDYHSMLSDYLTANSIFVAVIGLIVSRESPAMSLSLTVLILLLCIFGILLCLQMAIVLGRLTGQNALWEWKLRGNRTDSGVAGAETRHEPVSTPRSAAIGRRSARRAGWRCGRPGAGAGRRSG